MVSSEETGGGSAIVNAFRQTSTAIGIVILTAVITVIPGAPINGYHLAFLTAAGFGFCLGATASFSFSVT